VRRLFWVGVGVGGTILVLRWARRQRERFGPDALTTKAGETVASLRKLVRASIEEGRRAMEAKEAQLRGAYPSPTG
jgi:hypothetical protein